MRASIALRRWLLATLATMLVVAGGGACGGRAHLDGDRDPRACPPERPPVISLVDGRRGEIVTGPLHDDWVSRRVCGRAWRYLVLESAAPATDTQRARLAVLGVRAMAPVELAAPASPRRVVVTPDAATPSTRLLIHVPAEALAFLAVLPWVTAIWAPEAPPALPAWPQNIRDRLGPDVRHALREPPEVEYPVLETVVTVHGCLDGAQEALLIELGALVGRYPHSALCSTRRANEMLSVTSPVAVLNEIAVLPWIRSVDVPTGDLTINAR